MCSTYKGLNIIAALAALQGGVALADSWLAPTEQDYFAANEEYFLHVVPGDGSRPARGTLYQAFPARDAQDLWSRELENSNAPHKVLVADAGEYVVTFDDWGKVGYGPNVVVIYGPGGELVRTFALEDLLTADEIAAVPHTVSSRWWRGGECIDEGNGTLRLKVGLGFEPYGSPEPLPGVIVEKMVTILIRLADGEILP